MNKVILCIDDEQTVLETLESLLEGSFEGYDIELAQGGEDALELVDELKDEAHIEVVICDYIMPQMNGDKVLIELNKTIPDAKKILLTGQATMEGIKEIVNQVNLYRFIQKPWGNEDLRLTVEKALQQYQSEQELKEYMHTLEKKVEKRTQELQQKMEENLELKHKADQASASKSAFLASMSHEIRTPMNAILGFVEQLAKKEQDPLRLEHFNIIKNSGHTLLNIINDILDFSKIESGKMTLDIHPYKIHQLFHDTAALFKDLVKSKGITLIHNISDNLPECVTVDEVRLKQIIFNLLSNAVKFTPEKGSITLDIAYDLNQELLSCSVTDTGIGIAKENQAKIFNAFDQESSSTTRKFGGTGLGLSICTKLVAMMQGELKLSSALNEGSRFYFTIPAATCSLQKDDNENTQKSMQKLQGHVLMVEDNKTNQMLLSIILDEIGITYDIANDGQEGVAMSSENAYDVILMDENMPNLSGVEATKKIRAREQEHNLSSIPIIAVTANAFSEDKKRFFNAGMNDCVIKPYSEDKIYTVLYNYLFKQ